MTGPKSLRLLLAGWQPAGERTLPGSELGALDAAWPDLVGEDVARRTRTAGFRDGTLTVLTPSSAWSHQLTFLAPTILERLRARCPSVAVRRLRFSVATGRSRALLAGTGIGSGARGRAHAAGQSTRPHARGIAKSRRAHGHAGADALDAAAAAGEDPSVWLARLRQEQRRLDERRAQSGWLRCRSCGRWVRAAADPATCAVCAEDARRASDGRIARVLAQAPWLSTSDVVRELPEAHPRAVERVRRTLRTSWQQQMHNARARLRQGVLHAADRVIAWSYAMLLTSSPQPDISQPVLTGVVGQAWADALMGQMSPRSKKRKARQAMREKSIT